MFLLENIRNKYNELTSKLEEVKKEEEQSEVVREQIALEYKEKDAVYQAACDQFNKIESRINKRKEKYANKKCSNHVCMASFGTTLVSLIVAIININLGLITQPFYAYCGAAMLGCIAAAIDIELFWEKVKEKSFVKFEELESTKRTRDVSDVAYTEKLKAEKELREVQNKSIDHTKILNDIKRRKDSLEKDIRDIKISSFDQIMNANSQELDDQSLVLK